MVQYIGPYKICPAPRIQSAPLMVAFRYIIKPNFDSSIEPRKRDLAAARDFQSEPSTVQGGRRLRDAVRLSKN
jgi:hypothetical protein